MKNALISSILLTLLGCGGGSGTSPSSTPDVIFKLWMEGADFHRCGLDYVTVKVDGREIGILRDKGFGATWRVEVETYVSHGSHSYSALGHRPYVATNTITWEGTKNTNPTYGATVHLVCGS